MPGVESTKGVAQLQQVVQTSQGHSPVGISHFPVSISHPPMGISHSLWAYLTGALPCGHTPPRGLAFSMYLSRPFLGSLAPHTCSFSMYLSCSQLLNVPSQRTLAGPSLAGPPYVQPQHTRPCLLKPRHIHARAPWHKRCRQLAHSATCTLARSTTHMLTHSTTCTLTRSATHT